MKILNRKFSRDYESLETVEAGIVLTGGEVKSIRDGQCQLDGAFVKMLGDEVYLINSNIPPYEFASVIDYDPKRTRKLLLHRKEILRLQIKLKQGGRLTLAPISCYNRGRTIKLEVALCRPRKEIEKRKLEKGRDIERNQKREMREYEKS
ncbi:MAG: SsrA-binding protein SmpB [Patescibacteria group bacterium]